jgi:hypothetical protein
LWLFVRPADGRPAIRLVADGHVVVGDELIGNVARIFALTAAANLLWVQRRHDNRAVVRHRHILPAVQLLRHRDLALPSSRCIGYVDLATAAPLADGQLASGAVAPPDRQLAVLT